MNARSSRLHLAHPRDLTALFRDSLAVYWTHFWTFLAIGAAIVVPVELIVGGIGQEQLTAGYDSTTSVQETIVPTLVSFLVVAPLISAICIYALLNVAEGGQPKAREALIAGFEMFTPLFFAVALATAGTARRPAADRARHLPVRALVLRRRRRSCSRAPRRRRAAAQQRAHGRLLVAHVRPRAGRSTSRC